MEHIPGLDRHIESRRNDPFYCPRESAPPCPDCEGRGYVLSDPDGRMLTCPTCDGWGSDEAERAALADVECDEESGV